MDVCDHTNANQSLNTIPRSPEAWPSVSRRGPRLKGEAETKKASCNNTQQSPLFPFYLFCIAFYLPVLIPYASCNKTARAHSSTHFICPLSPAPPRFCCPLFPHTPADHSAPWASPPQLGQEPAARPRAAVARTIATTPIYIPAILPLYLLCPPFSSAPSWVFFLSFSFSLAKHTESYRRVLVS